MYKLNDKKLKEKENQIKLFDININEIRQKEVQEVQKYQGLKLQEKR